MNPNMSITQKEWDQGQEAERSPIGAALEELDAATRTAEGALSALTERIEPVTQPEEPTDLAAIAGEKTGRPRSVVLRRINENAEDVRRLADRMQRLCDRIDT